MKQDYKVYNVVLETHEGGIRRHPCRVVARNISEAWDLANMQGEEFNKHNDPKCVVQSVAFDSKVNGRFKHQIIGDKFVLASNLINKEKGERNELY